MTVQLYWYPKCSTCRNAKKWFDEHDITYELIDLVKDTPSEAELTDIIKNSDIPIKDFFNSRGTVYRELNLKEKLVDASPEEMVKYLASDGMLIKRPLATDGTKATLGFKADIYEQVWK